MAEVASKSGKEARHSRTRSLAFVALSIAIIAVSAWIVVPLGPIPFTLQMFSITFVIVALSPKEAVAAILGYLVLGAVGVPVFSGMRGGLGVLMGATGGFLWGYIIAVSVAVAFLWVVRRAKGLRSLSQTKRHEMREKSDNKVIAFLQNFGFDLVAGIIFTAISYVCGWGQYQIVAGVDGVQAFLVCCAPFIVVDLCKIIAAVIVAEAVRTVVGR